MVVEHTLNKAGINLKKHTKKQIKEFKKNSLEPITK